MEKNGIENEKIIIPPRNSEQILKGKMGQIENSEVSYIQDIEKQYSTLSVAF